MYSSSYKARAGTLKAFEDAYAREDFLRRSSSVGNVKGCTPSSEHGEKNDKEREMKCIEVNKSPSLRGKPKESSGLFSGMDGGDILLILLILFFLTDNDSENDGLIPVLLALILLF